MKVVTAYESRDIIVETDETEYPIYRRGGPKYWEHLIGEIWRPVYFNEDILENVYQKYLDDNKKE